MYAPMAEEVMQGSPVLQASPGQDANGITIGQWTSPVIPEEPESIVNMEDCCPCVPLAQIEVRLGLTSYAVIVSQSYRDATSVLARVLLLLGMLALIAIPLLLLLYPIAGLRGSVRKRFDIPGSEREDRMEAWLETARVIRQMRRHLKIDQAKCGTVTTLPAYVV